MDIRISAKNTAILEAENGKPGFVLEIYDADIPDLLDQIGIDAVKKHFHPAELERLFS